MKQNLSFFKYFQVVLFFSCVLLLVEVACAQSPENKKKIRQANGSFIDGDFKIALPLFLEFAENFEPGIIKKEVLDFRIGFCYYSSLLEQEKAITWFEKYLSVTDSIYDVHYFLATSYHLEHRFNEAVAQYEAFKVFAEKDSLTPKVIIDQVVNSLERNIERCNYGKMLIINPVDVVVENLGNQVNTPFSEYAPVIAPDESKIVFTRRSPETTGGKISPDKDFYEDIYISTVEEGSLFSAPNYDSLKGAGFNILLTDFKFSAPQSISPNINSKTHDGAIQFSYDGKKLYIYRDFNVWVSELINEQWTVPISLTDLKNVLYANAFEPSVSMSINGDVIYFASDRMGGEGGLDIYKSSKQSDGTWSFPENLGPEINTRYDEDSPYIDPDGRTLYFSSKGHSSMGGYDIFKTIFNNGEWRQPQNVGYPLNSASDDIFFMMTPRYNRGYYSSNRPGGFGKMDIYRITFANERMPLAEIRGLVLKGDTLVPAYSRITIYDPKSGDEISTHNSDSVSGEYLLLFAHGLGYKIKVETDGFAPYEKKFNIPEKVKYYQYYQEIHHVYLRDHLGNIIGQKIMMYNATFDNDSLSMDTIFSKNSAGSIAQLLEELKNKNLLKFEELADVKFYITRDSVLTLMKKYPDLKFNFSEETTVSFLDTTLSTDRTKLEAYIAGDARSLILTPLTTEKEIKEVMDPVNSAVEIPSILLYFDYEKEEIKQEAKQKLNSFIDFLKNNSGFSFYVVGHTDSNGPEALNTLLSVKRAESVKVYLEKNGISPSRLKVIGKGENQPIAPNTFADGSDNPEGRMQNRRVEFKIFKVD